MIKIRLTPASGRPCLVLGLSRNNIAELLAGNQIHIDGAQLGVPIDVGIIAGDTEPAILDTLAAAGIIDEATAAKYKLVFQFQVEVPAAKYTGPLRFDGKGNPA